MSEHTQLPEVQLSPRRLRLAAVIGVLVFGSIAVIGTTTRIVQARNLHQWTDEQAIPTVLISEPENANGSAPLELPAQMDAFTNAPIYARTSGIVLRAAACRCSPNSRRCCSLSGRTDS